MSEALYIRSASSVLLAMCSWPYSSHVPPVACKQTVSQLIRYRVGSPCHCAMYMEWSAGGCGGGAGFGGWHVQRRRDSRLFATTLQACMGPQTHHQVAPPLETCNWMFGVPKSTLACPIADALKTPFAQTSRPDCTLVAAAAMAWMSASEFPKSTSSVQARPFCAQAVSQLVTGPASMMIAGGGGIAGGVLGGAEGGGGGEGGGEGGGGGG